jgi:hypothetical protein
VTVAKMKPSSIRPPRSAMIVPSIFVPETHMAGIEFTMR